MRETRKRTSSTRYKIIMLYKAVEAPGIRCGRLPQQNIDYYT